VGDGETESNVEGEVEDDEERRRGGLAGRKPACSRRVGARTSFETECAYLMRTETISPTCRQDMPLPETLHELLL
jgi:hypothetical protein